MQRIGIYESPAWPVPRRTQPVTDFGRRAAEKTKTYCQQTQTHSQSPTIPRWRHLPFLARKITQPDGVWVRHSEPVSRKRHRAASAERNKNGDSMLLWLMGDGA